MFGITNWQTTLGGFSAVLAAAATGAHALSVGDFNAALLAIPPILAGIGLMSAKDHNVTGGTVPMTSEASRRTGVPLASAEAKK